MQFGWIDFSKQDRTNAINIINSMKEKGVLDELGFGSLRQAFANDFFPGTSTIQTRAKYFFIVPYILQDFIAKVSATENDFQKFAENALKEISGLNKAEHQTGKILVQNMGKDEKIGIIGSRSIAGGKWVKRTPLSIYWNGLRSFGFFRSKRPNYALADFFMNVFTLKRNEDSFKNATKPSKNDDSDDVDAGNFSKTNPLVKLGTYTKNWKENLSINLTNAEAEILKEKIIESMPDSLLAFILQNKIDISSCSGNFEAASSLLFEKVNPEMAKKLDLANKANEFFYMTMLRYSFLLCKDEVAEIKSEWECAWKNKTKICNNFDINETFSTMKIQNARLKLFLTNLKSAFLSDDLEKASEIIIRREKDLKGKRAKLSNAEYTLSDEDKKIFSRFDYRLVSAARIIKDIFDGENQ